jgi:tripartite-type tricarboxylate transporter receptor subunit TctC
MSGWNGLFAPKGTPEVVISRLRAALELAHRDETVMTRFDEVASEVPEPVLVTGPGLRDFVAAEIARWVGVVKAAGVAPQPQ